MLTPTITVETPTGLDNALVMQWPRQARQPDIIPAFQRVTRYLDEAPAPVYLILNLSDNPDLPGDELVRGALHGPYAHPHLGGWIVVGANEPVQAMAAALADVTTCPRLEDALDFVAGHRLVQQTA